MGARKQITLQRIPTHTGRVLSDEWDIFAKPPQVIGTIISLQTTRRRDDEPRTIGERLPAALGIGILAALGTALASSILKSIRLEIPMAYSVGIGAVVAFIAFRLRRRTFELTFVGDYGLARFRLSENSDRESPTVEVLSFDDVTELRMTEVHNYLKGGFVGAGYAFNWLDKGHRERFSIRGAHHSENGNPPEESSYYFGLAADRVWTRRVIERCESALANSGTAEFRVFSDGIARVGRGFVEFQFGQRIERLTPFDIRLIKIDDGALHIETVSRKWYQRRRICRIAYDHISNATAFLTLLQQYGGFCVLS